MIILETSEFHVFVDASKRAYAACIFVRSVDSNGLKINLVRAKSRVAPLKIVSIPRLELLSCCIGARLANSVRNALDLPEWFLMPPDFWPSSNICYDTNEIETERREIKLSNVNLSEESTPCSQTYQSSGTFEDDIDDVPMDGWEWQAVERIVKLVTKASRKRVRQQNRDGFIRAILESRK
ncbi:hypothetical protein AVEN_68274-1 [Araneus ventricosus]|uniref:Uncharacterized protein n=1 Tax=Araneus ventricosus TaxID=182803 RepID=A0A4Y2HL77_ARAVE|nr:hypothetical protein AVEN_68274-1 [Araneus ventricosus]